MAAFLFLIAANQAIEAYRATGPGAFADLGVFRWATIFAIADPLLLYAFAAVYPKRNRLASAARWVPLLAAAGALAAWSLLVPTTTPYDRRFLWGEFGLAGYTAVVYVTVWFRVLGEVASDERMGPRLLYPALCVAAFPVAERLGSDLAQLVQSYLAWPAEAFPIARLALWVPVLGGFLAVAYRRSLTMAASGAFIRRSSLGAVALTVLVNNATPLAILAFLGLIPENLSIGFLGTAAAAIRWLLFGAFVSVAVVRYELLGMSLQWRRRAARFLVAFAFLAVATLAVGTFQGALGRTRPSLSPLELALLVGAVLLSQGFRNTVGRVASWFYGVPDRASPAATAETYRAAVVEALEKGMPVDAPPLKRLRAELGLDEGTAGVVAHLASTTLGGPIAVGQLVGGRYRVARFLGRGGAGRAFLAHDELLDRPVALKEVLTDVPDEEAAVLREARLAAGLQHPNVVTLYDVVRRPGSALIVSEYVSGGSLEEHLQGKSLELGAGLRVIDGVLSGLEAIHDRGVVHRDLKPANVLLQADGTAKIADFGIARARRGVTARFDDPGTLEGTPEVMAPEQRRGEIGTPASDVYQVGLLMRTVLPSPLPSGVAAVVERALHASPESRWLDARRMRSALRPHLARTSPLLVH